MTETYNDKGYLYLGASRWYGYSGLPHATTIEITAEKLEFNARVFFGLLKKAYIFEKKIYF